MSGGTENHQVLVDLRTFDDELTGKVAQEVLDRAGITCNRNTIPDDPRSPFITSGLRLGSAAQTTAGMGPDEMRAIGALIGRTLRRRDDDAGHRPGPGRGPRAVRRLPPVPHPGRDVTRERGSAGERRASRSTGTRVVLVVAARVVRGSSPSPPAGSPSRSATSPSPTTARSTSG